jgi:iron complex outermembrane receptor protein
LRSRIQVYRNQYRYGVAVPDPVNQDETRGQWWNATAHVAYTGWNAHRIVAGAEIQQDGRQDYSNDDLAPAYSRWRQTGGARKLAVFVDDAWTPAEAWQLHLGLRLDRSWWFGLSTGHSHLGEVSVGAGIPGAQPR